MKQKFLLTFGLLASSVFAQKYMLVEILKRDEKQSIKSEKAYIQINQSKNTLSGKSICNSFIATWNKQKELGNIGSTMMLCNDEENKLEREILNGFVNAKIFFSPNEIRIINNAGEMIFRSN